MADFKWADVGTFVELRVLFLYLESSTCSGMISYDIISLQSIFLSAVKLNLTQRDQGGAAEFFDRIINDLSFVHY